MFNSYISKFEIQIVCKSGEQIADQLRDADNERKDNQARLHDLLMWLQGTKTTLEKRNNIDLPLNDISALFKLKFEHEDFKANFLTKQHDFDDIMRIYRQTGKATPSKSRLPTSTSSRRLEFTHPKEGVYLL